MLFNVVKKNLFIEILWIIMFDSRVLYRMVLKTNGTAHLIFTATFLGEKEIYTLHLYYVLNLVMLEIR